MPMGACLRDLNFEVWDVFTDSAYAGNPLGIVTGADGLSTAQMQTIARQFNLSETIFVMAPRDAANTARVRIFFPTAEIPFAGHPTIGCALFLATRDQLTEVRLEEEAGLVPVTLTATGGTLLAEFRAPVLPHRPQAGSIAALPALAQAVDLAPAQLGPDQPGLFTGGPSFLYIPVQDLPALARSRPMEPAWSQVTELAGVDSAYLYTATGENSYRARMYAPRGGIPEDPATGSASALFAAQLLANKALPENGETRISLQQGVEMGRPSQIGLRITTRVGTLSAVHVSGRAVPVAGGQITPPAV